MTNILNSLNANIIKYDILNTYDAKRKNISGLELLDPTINNYIVIDSNNLIILNNHNKGYSSFQKALIALVNKLRTESNTEPSDKYFTDVEKIAPAIAIWIDANPSFNYLMELREGYVNKMYDDENNCQFNAAWLKPALKNIGFIDLPFSEDELLEYWEMIH